MRLHARFMARAALGAALALSGSLGTGAAGIEVSGGFEAAPSNRLFVDAADLCLQASWYPLAVRPHFGPAGCVSTLDGGGLIWFDLPQGLLKEARFRSSFLVPSAPLSGVTPFGIQQLNHLLVAYLFEQGGIAVALIADNGEVPPPPSSLEGEILGQIAYGVPFEVIVNATMLRHRLTVRQEGEVIASATREKAVAHADPLTYFSLFSAPGVFEGLTLHLGSAEFKSLALNRGSGPFQSGPVIGGLTAERAGDRIRLIAH